MHRTASYVILVAMRLVGVRLLLSDWSVPSGAGVPPDEAPSLWELLLGGALVVNTGSHSSLAWREWPPLLVSSSRFCSSPSCNYPFGFEKSSPHSTLHFLKETRQGFQMKAHGRFPDTTCSVTSSDAQKQAAAPQASPGLGEQGDCGCFAGARSSQPSGTGIPQSRAHGLSLSQAQLLPHFPKRDRPQGKRLPQGLPGLTRKAGSCFSGLQSAASVALLSDRELGTASGCWECWDLNYPD